MIFPSGPAHVNMAGSLHGSNSFSVPNLVFVFTIWLLFSITHHSLQCAYASGWIVIGKAADPAAPPPCQSFCVNVWRETVVGHPLFPYFCMKGTETSKEQWTYDNQMLTLSVWRNYSTALGSLCMERSDLNQVVLAECSGNSSAQKWVFEGSHIRNGDPSDALYLHASTPPIDNSNIKFSAYFLYVAELSGGPNISEFTMLPLSVLQNVPSLPPANTSNLIQNGGFDNLSLPFGSSSISNLFSYSICGWIIQSDVIAVPISYSGSAQGTYSINLGSLGLISQTVPTYAGAQYFLMFQLSRNRSCTASAPAIRVQLAPSLVPKQDFYFNSTENNQEWQSQHLTFVASGAYLDLNFVSLTSSNSCGPILDNVELYYLEGSLQNIVTSTQRGASHLLVPLVIGWATAAALAVSGFWLFRVYSSRRTQNSRHQQQNDIKRATVRKYSLAEVRLLTGNFHELIGRGGFGDVYRGRLANGTAIAVKRGFRGGDDLFGDELDMLYRVHHRCILDFIGYCNDEDEQILLAEYMPKGSLYQQLHLEKNPVLTWRCRMRIAFKVAYGLEYLHHGADPPVLHRDVKSANILLAEDFSPKIADFGISKIGKWNAGKVASTVTQIKGSHGYIDPEYNETSVLSEKSDVYSYGVVLLELISGRPAVLERGETLVRWALASVTEMEHIVDKNLSGLVDEDELHGVMDVVRLCLRREGIQRPFMFEVVSLLREKLSRSLVEDPLFTRPLHHNPSFSNSSDSSSTTAQIGSISSMGNVSLGYGSLGSSSILSPR